MFNQLIQFDHQLFLGINQGLSNAFFDWLMPLLRNRYFWAPLYLFLIVFLPRHYGKAGYLCILFLLLTFALSDFTSSSLIKPLAGRLRPCNEPGFNQEINSLVACGTGYSFPSSHATNHFALAVFLITVFFKSWKPILPLGLLWAASIAFAQVYVGVHFPLDIFAGALLGSLIGSITGTVFYQLYMKDLWSFGS